MKDPNYSVCKIFCHPDKIKEYLNDKVKSPISVELHITNNCNYKCLWCEPNLLGRTNRKAEMPKKRLMKLASEFIKSDVKGVLLSGGGEPLLHPNFSEFVNKLTKNKISVGVFTNGSLISSKNIEALLKCDFVRISFDAGNKENYNRVHNTKAFNDVCDNIRILTQEKRIRKLNINIGASYVISEYNLSKNEIKEFISLMNSLNIDYVQLRPVRLEHTFHLSETVLDDIQQEIKNVTTTNLKIIYNPHHNYKYNTKEERQYDFCHMTNFQVVISPEGNMFPCYGFIHRNDKCIGTIKNHFIKTWRNRKINIDCKSECVECRFHLQNKMLDDLKKIRDKNFI